MGFFDTSNPEIIPNITPKIQMMMEQCRSEGSKYYNVFED